jgi:ribosomal protein S18 acetylase RimI-like enzyme
LDDDNCCGVLLPPGSGGEVGNPIMLLHERFEGMNWAIGEDATSRLLGAVERPAEPAKAELFGRADRFYSVLLVGTKLEAREKGLCSALIRYYQGIAAESGLPILLATYNERALRLYTRYGFEIVENMLTGKGTCDADGRKEEGGPGIAGWALLWRPTTPS